MLTNTQNPAVDTVKELFGEHPEDVIGPMKSASDALMWLEEIFVTIKNEALIERNGNRIKQLAEAGAHLATNVGDYAGARYEHYIDRLKAAGVEVTEG